jgi:hypothetical protein
MSLHEDLIAIARGEMTANHDTSKPKKPTFALHMEQHHL